MQNYGKSLNFDYRILIFLDVSMFVYVAYFIDKKIGTQQATSLYYISGRHYELCSSCLPDVCRP